MTDKDLLTLQSSFDSDSAIESDFDELDCADPLNLSGRCDLHKGFSIEIIEHPHSMKQVANIVIALHRLKHLHKVHSTECNGRELFNFIIENVIEERMEIDMQYSHVARAFEMFGKVKQCTICDQTKKSLVQPNNDSPLLAMTLKGGNTKQVWFHLSTYLPSNFEDPNGQPVCLGIIKSNLYLSCKEVNKVPCLCLEVVKDRETLKTIHEKDDMVRFLFLRRGLGASINTFESVKYPGWFISTSENEKSQVDMSKTQTKRIRDFTLNDQKSVSDNEI